LRGIILIILAAEHRNTDDEYEDRVTRLEGENERFRHELRQLRTLISNNIQMHEEQVYY